MRHHIIILNVILIVGVLLLLVDCQEKIEPEVKPELVTITQSTPFEYVFDLPTKAIPESIAESSNGINHFTLFGWYRGGNEYGPWAISYYAAPFTTNTYTLRNNGDYVVSWGRTIEDNPLWKKAQYDWEGEQAKSRFWAWTDFCDNSTLTTAATTNMGADENNKLHLYCNYKSKDKDFIKASKQTDLQVAYSEQFQGKIVEDDRVYLNFQHCLTRVIFEGDYKSVCFKNYPGWGHCTVTQDGTITWSDISLPMTFGTDKSNTLYLLPYKGKIELIIDDNRFSTDNVTINVDWQVGKSYTYTLTPTKALCVDVALTEECYY